MSERSFVYLLGIIKWINLMSVFVGLSIFLTRLEIPSIFSIIILLISIGVTDYLINKWISRKFGNEHLIENTRIFKIINILVFIMLALFLITRELWSYLVIIGIYVFVSKAIELFSRKSKQNIAENRSNLYE